MLCWGDVGGYVNALFFSSVTMALFDRPPAPAGEKQGNGVFSYFGMGVISLVYWFL